MLYVFVGDDTVKARSRAHRLLEEGGGSYEHVTAQSVSAELLSELAFGASLFGGSLPAVLLDSLSDDDVALSALDDSIDILVSSPRIFVYVDASLGAPRQARLKKSAHSFESFPLESTRKGFDTFLLADAFSRRDKRSLWVLLARAHAAGVAGEEIAGVLFWQLKAMRLAAETKTSAEAGMKDYPYKKAKAGLTHFSKEELALLSHDLVRVYHEGHAGIDMDIGLERFVLRL